MFGEKTLKINFELKVKDKGYIKSGTIKLDNNQNFVIKANKDIGIKDNQIKIKQVSQNMPYLISIPIEFKRQDTVEENFVNGKNKITFSGTYVDNEAIEHTIEKTIDLNLIWNEKTSTTVDCKVIKNLDYKLEDGTNGKIVQTNVKLSNTENKNNNLPVRSSNIKIDIPQISGMELRSTNVTSNKLAYTQGQEDYNIEFTENNYKIEENALIINTENIERDGKISNSYGEDIYTITYIYSGNKTSDELIHGKIDMKLTNYASQKEEQTIDVEYNFNEAIGNLVQYTREDKDDEISKGYLMANSQMSKYEISYTKRDILNINRAELITSLEISDKDEYFVEDGDKHIYYTQTDSEIMSTYTSTEFSRENLINILGQDGNVEILNMNNDVINNVTFDLHANENGSYIINYSEPISKIKIRTSKPIADGNLTILSTKAIKELIYSRNLVKDFYKLVNISEGTVTYNEGVTDTLGEVESTILINPTSSNASIEVAKTELSTTTTNENVNFQIHLNNNSDISDLYENPVFEVRLPQAVKNVKVKNIDLFYANNELEIANVETIEDKGNKIIRITLSGIQTSYNLNKETNGTIISFDLDLDLDEFTLNKQEDVVMYYYNSASVKYENQVDWAMCLGLTDVSYFKNGSSIAPLNFKAPEGLVNGQTTNTKPEQDETEDNQDNSNKVTSIKQGAQSELIEENAPAKLATMSIAIMNNTDKKYSNFQILGRVPFAGNKDITTGEDLGTTVDCILDSVVSSSNKDLLYTVYYSENGEATNDLTDEANGWKDDMYKSGTIKSYLIILNSDYILEPQSSLEFTYDYVIPANLTSGDAFFGTYATYYKEETGKSNNSSADKIGYQTEKKTNIEAQITLAEDTLKELSDAEYEIVLKNNTNIDAKNLNINFEIPQEFMIENIEGNNVSGTLDNGVITINAEKLKANSEEKIIARFAVSRFEEEENKVKISAKVNGENLQEPINIETEEKAVEKTKVQINDKYYEHLKVAGREYENTFSITNVTDNEYKNVKITKRLGENFDFTGSKIETIASETKGLEEGLKSAKESGEEITDEKFEEILKNAESTKNQNLNVTENYDMATQTITWEIESLKPNDYVEIKYNTYIKITSSEKTENTDNIITEIDLKDGTNPIKTENKIRYKQSQLEIKPENNYEIGYGKGGDEITYIWNIKNKNNYDITDFKCTPTISENANITSMRLETTKKETEYDPQSTQTIYGLIPKNATAKLIITAKINDDANNYVENKISSTYDMVYSNEESAYTLLENNSEVHQLTGSSYIDKNRNQKFDLGEQILQGIVVNLYNSETNELVDSEITDVSGRYTFDNLSNGTYYVKFNYDESEYLISSEKSDTMIANKSNIINVNDNYITDNIEINDKSVSNIDIALVDDDIFDMKIDMSVEKMIVQNSKENTEYIPENKKLGKVDIDPKLVSGSKVFIEYKIAVTNQGTIPGKVEKIVDYMASGMEFDSNLNKDWYIESDGNIYTRSLKDENINPGETKELTLILIKKMTEDNTGLVHNSIEIADSSNSKGIPDIDSTPGNGLLEDDLNACDCIIGISTGLSIGITPIIIVVIIISIVVGFIIWRIIEKRRYV